MILHDVKSKMMNCGLYFFKKEICCTLLKVSGPRISLDKAVIQDKTEKELRCHGSQSARRATKQIALSANA